MAEEKNSPDLKIENIYMTVIGIILFINILTPCIYPVQPVFPFLIYPGWVILLSGLVLVLFSVRTLSRQGIGDLIEKGVYGIVRHPLYVGASIMFFSHMFFFQHWFYMLDSFLAMGMIHRIILREEKRLRSKYPKKYAEYASKVPRINFMAGLGRRYFHQS